MVRMGAEYVLSYDLSKMTNIYSGKGKNDVKSCVKSTSKLIKNLGKKLLFRNGELTKLCKNLKGQNGALSKIGEGTMVQDVGVGRLQTRYVQYVKFTKL